MKVFVAGLAMATRFDTASHSGLETRVLQLRPDSARQWGRMTPHQAICHMSDALRMSLNERPVAPSDGRLQPLIRFVALTLPMPWPRGRLKTVPEAEQGIGGTPPGDFERDRRDLLELMARFCAAGADGLCPTHPIFGPMTTDHWKRWGYLHMDHHLRQFGV
jgi:uncharacterized protein DUF1569